jgi:hypothetical protein
MPPNDRRPSDQRTNKDPIANELGAAQAEIMNVIWETEGATVPEIRAVINEKRKTGAAYTTVLTFVRRLYARDLLTREPGGTHVPLPRHEEPGRAHRFLVRRDDRPTHR